MRQAERSLRSVLLATLGAGVLAELAAIAITWHTSVSHPEVRVYTYFLEGLVNGPATLALALVLTLRRPDHRVSWAFVAMATTAGVQLAAGAYAHEALATGAPGGEAALFASTAAQSVFVMTWVLLLLLFPTGDTISPRWRVLVWAALIALPWVALSHLMAPDPFADDPSFSHVEGPLFAAIPPMARAALSGITGVLVFSSLFGGIVQLYIRFRRGEELVRNQLKWFFFAVVVALFALFVPWPGADRVPGWLLWSLAPLGIWTAVAVAILKHRLYEIDLIINRALVYGLLTAMLATAYLGVVVVLQALMQPLTRESDLAVAAATLAVAALFRPMRSRVQTFIDHRFYRRKYDLGSTMGAFSASLRDQVDLSSLTQEVIAVVGTTMQPAHASLWLRPTERATGGRA